MSHEFKAGNEEGNAAVKMYFKITKQYLKKPLIDKRKVTILFYFFN